MKKVIGLVSLIVAMSLGACMTEAPASDSESEATGQLTAAPEAASVTPAVEVPEAFKILPRGTAPRESSATTSCNTVYGPCKVGACEFQNDTYQNGSTVCCTEGVCTVQNFRACGC